MAFRSVFFFKIVSNLLNNLALALISAYFCKVFTCWKKY